MIDLLDATLRELIIQKGVFDPDSIEVSFDQPTGDWAAGLTRPTINCYLYDVRENSELRSAEWIVGQNDKGQATKRLAPRRFNLSYLVTVWTQKQVDDEHAILWRVLGALSSHPILPVELCQGELKRQVYPITSEAAQPSAVIDNLPDLWSVMDTPLRPSINYVVTLAMEREVAFTSALVLTKRVQIKARDDLGPGESIWQIGGIVTHEGQPVIGASVLDLDSGRSARTDAYGRYSLANVSPGRRRVAVEAAGVRREHTFVVPADDHSAAFYDLTV